MPLRRDGHTYQPSTIFAVLMGGTLGPCSHPNQSPVPWKVAAGWGEHRWSKSMLEVRIGAGSTVRRHGEVQNGVRNEKESVGAKVGFVAEQGPGLHCRLSRMCRYQAVSGAAVLGHIPLQALMVTTGDGGRERRRERYR
jgi:hypothetical protein